MNNIQQRNHSFFLKVGEKIEQQIGIDEMKAGAHDFVLLAFKDNGKSERFTGAEMAPLYFRMNIFVGCYDVPSVNYDIAVSTEAHLGTGGIRLERQWTVVGPATKDLPMIPAWVENSSEHEQEYVIVPFVQDPETGTLENEFTPRYIRVPGRTRQSYELPLGTQGARKGGVIRAILAPNPYMRLEDPRGAIVQKPSELNTSNAVE